MIENTINDELVGGGKYIKKEMQKDTYYLYELINFEVEVKTNSTRTKKLITKYIKPTAEKSNDDTYLKKNDTINENSIKYKKDKYEKQFKEKIHIKNGKLNLISYYDGVSGETTNDGKKETQKINDGKNFEISELGDIIAFNFNNNKNEKEWGFCKDRHLDRVKKILAGDIKVYINHMYYVLEGFRSIMNFNIITNNSNIIFKEKNEPQTLYSTEIVYIKLLYVLYALTYNTNYNPFQILLNKIKNYNYEISNETFNNDIKKIFCDFYSNENKQIFIEEIVNKLFDEEKQKLNIFNKEIIDILNEFNKGNNKILQNNIKTIKGEKEESYIELGKEYLENLFTIRQKALNCESDSNVGNKGNTASSRPPSYSTIPPNTSLPRYSTIIKPYIKLITLENLNIILNKLNDNEKTEFTIFLNDKINKQCKEEIKEGDINVINTEGKIDISEDCLTSLKDGLTYDYQNFKPYLNLLQESTAGGGRVKTKNTKKRKSNSTKPKNSTNTKKNKNTSSSSKRKNKLTKYKRNNNRRTNKKGTSRK